MDKDRALTYSLLAHIRTKSTLVGGPLDIFKPLIKRVLSKMNYDGIFSGKNISEIKNYSDKLYDLDFPIPVIETILKQIANELNDDDGNTLFAIYNDKSFMINGYVFSEFEEDIRKHQQKIKRIEDLFQDFCKSSGFEIENKSIFKFIEKNKYSLSKYLSRSDDTNGDDYSIEAQFIDYFKRITPVYESIKEIYLGSILAGYVEFSPENVKVNIELLLDTNFVLGLLDLNTPESTHTCCTLLKIAHSQGYTCKVMSDTIEEIKSLIDVKSRFFDQSFLQKKVYPEDIYNACERRGLSKVDLERISDNLEIELSKLNIYVLYETSKLRKEAKFSDEYNSFKKIRNSDKSALHDAMAIRYVKNKRGKIIYDFEKVNCWFVNNAISREGQNSFDRSGRQPEVIKADDLLNILWLSNPQSKVNISDEEIVDIGLSSLISLTLNESLPKTSIIRELEDNIQKYAGQEISDNDIILIATRIANKQLVDVEILNELADSNKEEFVKRLEDEAKKQADIESRRFKMFENALERLNRKAESFERKENELEIKSKNIDELRDSTDNKIKEIEIVKLRALQEINFQREKGRKDFYKEELKKWRRRSWYEFIGCLSLISIIILYVLNREGWNMKNTYDSIKNFEKYIIISSLFSILIFVFTGIFVKTLYAKYRNHSNIQNYKKELEERLPEDLKVLSELPEIRKSKGSF